jgi:hypothetical protein
MEVLMKTLKRSEIIEERGVCPYCMNFVELTPTDCCCSEVHGELGYVTKDEVYLKSEVTIEEDL